MLPEFFTNKFTLSEKFCSCRSEERF